MEFALHGREAPLAGGLAKDGVGWLSNTDSRRKARSRISRFASKLTSPNPIVRIKLISHILPRRWWMRCRRRSLMSTTAGVACSGGELSLIIFARRAGGSDFLVLVTGIDDCGFRHLYPGLESLILLLIAGVYLPARLRRCDKALPAYGLYI